MEPWLKPELLEPGGLSLDPSNSFSDLCDLENVRVRLVLPQGFIKGMKVVDAGQVLRTMPAV